MFGCFCCPEVRAASDQPDLSDLTYPTDQSRPDRFLPDNLWGFDLAALYGYKPANRLQR
jgi:hypothetical protein